MATTTAGRKVVRTRVAGLVAASHPAPTAVVTVVSGALTAGAGGRAGTVVLVVLAVLAGQLSVGWSNDWVDAARDRAVGRVDKPVVAGLVPEETVRAGAFTALAVCAAASWTVGVLAGSLHVLAVVGAWAYNLGLKRTAWSWAPYAVSFGLLPAFCVLAVRTEVPPALVAAGALLGAGAHVANVLPDLTDDAVTGVRGLPHRIGRRGSSVLAPAVLVAGVAVVAGGLPERSTTTWVIALAATGLAVAAGTVGIVRPRSRVPFTLSMAVAVVCVALIVTAGQRLG